jgi:hypothetical protein
MILAILLLLVAGGFAANGAVSSYASNSAPSVNKPVFVWMFGYTGDAFYPQSQLGLSPAQTISIAQQISAKVGKDNLRIVSSVGLEGGGVGSGSIATEKNYVSTLKQYASVVYGRVDMQDYENNLVSAVSVLVRSIGVNGLWFDEGPKLWAAKGSGWFNSQMQNLENTYPGLNIIMNQALVDGGYIKPAAGDSWGSHTYISPSVGSGGCCSVDMSEINALNSIYPGRVLLHFDAFAKVPTEPMGIFANQQSGTETSEIRSLSSSSHNYDFLFPVLGAWTYYKSQYKGTMYNSMSMGSHSRGTFSSFLSDMSSI